SAVTLAGLKKLVQQGFVKPDETVALVLTGNLLKDPDFTIEFHRGEMFDDPSTAKSIDSLRHPAIVLDATLDAVLRSADRAKSSSSHDEEIQIQVEIKVCHIASGNFGKSRSSIRCSCACDGFLHQDRRAALKTVLD